MLSEQVACAAVSPHPYILSYIQVQCHPPLRQLQSDFGYRTTGVGHVLKTAEEVGRQRGNGQAWVSAGPKG